MNKLKNNKLHSLLLLLLLLATHGSAQQGWQWGKRGGALFGGSNYNDADQVVGMVTDKQGNLYVLANIYNENADIGGIPFPAPPPLFGYPVHQHIALVSYDCTGNFRWMKSLGGGGYDFADR